MKHWRALLFLLALLALAPGARAAEDGIRAVIVYEEDADPAALTAAVEALEGVELLWRYGSLFPGAAVEADETALQKTFILPESVAAPIHEGDVIGAVRLSLAGEELGTVGWSATARSSAATCYTTSNCSSALSAGCTFAPSLCCWRCWSSSTPF